MRLFFLCLAFAVVAAEQDPTWPLPYSNYSRRPTRDQRCSILQPFCPGEMNIRKLSFDPNDEIDIFVLTHQTSDFDLTPMDSFKRVKVGLKLHSRMTSKNFTISYSPFSSVLDATVPLLFPKEMLWCNQAAVCVTSQKDSSDWSGQQRVGMIGGDKVDELLTWLLYFNNTKPFFQTFTLMDSTKAAVDGKQVWMLQFDDTRFFLQTINLLKAIGALLFKNSTIQLSSIAVICDTPQLLGTPAELQKKNPKAFDDAKSFFENLQPSHNIITRIYHRFMFFIDIDIEKKFYYLFNENLWKLKLVSPKMVVQTVKINL